jgi:hypothetical protein
LHSVIIFNNIDYQFIYGMKLFYVCFLLVLSVKVTFSQQVAFPGADGFGRFATGGRGGSVYHVVNLNDGGEGSFRDAVSKPNRTVVFDIGGVIQINDKIHVAAQTTIAGQTAPGDGIVIYGNGLSFSDNCITRYIRFRGSINMPRGACVVVVDSVHDVIFDHISVEWGRWDDFHIKDSKNVTVQYALIGEPIDPQRFGALFENPERVTIQHCLWIDNQSRNPKAKAGIEYIDNVIYNWGVNGLVGGHSGAVHNQDIINNYFIAGPNSGHAFIGMFSATDQVYHSGNYVDMNKDGILNGRLIVDTDFVHAEATLKTARQNTGMDLKNIETATAAFGTVLAEAGASLHRDAVDERIIGYLKSLGKEGKIFKSEVDAGGQPKLNSGTPLKDTDGDGIPDAWEKANHLNPNNAADANTKATGCQYTTLEVYLNSLVAKKK